MSTVLNRTETKRTYEIEAGGSAGESVGGIAVVALSILALAGVMPMWLAPIAGIAFGAALLIEGAAMAVRHSELMAQVAATEEARFELSEGMSVEAAVGIACIALGILALVGVAPAVLLPSLAITGGAGLIVSAGTLRQLNEIRADALDISPTPRRVARTAVSSAAATQVLAGVAAITLGVIALVEASSFPSALTITALLVLGSAVLMSGATLSSRMLTALSHSRAIR